jgi:hypothetical protein
MKFVWGSGVIAVCAVFFAGAAVAGNSCDTDYNGDGATDTADVEILQAALGTQNGDDAFVAQADLDGDGFISVKDYGIMLRCN